MTRPTQNQAQAGPAANVLRDENVPNTLGGVGPPTTAVRLRVPVGALVAATVVIVAVLVMLVAR